MWKVAIAVAMLLIVPLRAAELDLLEQRAFQAAVDRVAPSVVRIETVGGRERLGESLLGTGPTTGLVVDAEGYVLTSQFNFLSQPDSILVRLSDGRRRPARRVAADTSRGLVLLKIETDQPLPVPEWTRRDQMRVGQWAIAVGRTFESDRPNLSVGILSALERIWGKAIQTDAAASPSNYGGPLVDIHGRVLGLIVPLAPTSEQPLAGAEWYDSGIGFAVPAEDFLKVLPRLKRGEDLKAGVAGVSLAPGEPNTAEPVIAACRPGSPAAASGLREGDRVVEVDGRPVARAAELLISLKRHYAGDKLALVVQREGKRLEMSLQLVAELPPYEHPFLGILPRRGRPAEGDPGVVVRHVLPGSPAAAAGIQPGDRITKLAGRAVADTEALRRRMAEHAPEETVAVSLHRGQTDQAVEVTLGRLPDDPPADPLPPIETLGPAPEGPRPATGKIDLKVPDLENRAWAYVPSGYRPDVACGVLVWLDPPGESADDVLVDRFKALCEGHGLILLVPKPTDPSRWLGVEEAAVARLLDELLGAYAVDRHRTVIAGREGGGTLAYLVAMAHRELVGGVVASSAAMTVEPPPGDPAHRLAFYVAASAAPRDADRARRAVEQLRAKKYPVALRSLGEVPRPFTPEELAELARWIDALDRI